MNTIGNLAEIVCMSTLDESLPWNNPTALLAGYDAVILGGSGEFDLHGDQKNIDKVRRAQSILRLSRPLIEYILANDVPTLGVCFGHQLIGEIRGGEVSTDTVQKKAGSFEVSLTTEGKKDLIFGQFPETFVAQYGHKNSLTKLPNGATLLANSDICNFSALRYSPRIYTVQFHPELSPSDVLRKFASAPDYLPDGMSAESLVRESPEASRIIPLFVAKIASGSSKSD